MSMRLVLPPIKICLEVDFFSPFGIYGFSDTRGRGHTGRRPHTRGALNGLDFDGSGGGGGRRPNDGLQVDRKRVLLTRSTFASSSCILIHRFSLDWLKSV